MRENSEVLFFCLNLVWERVFYYAALWVELTLPFKRIKSVLLKELHMSTSFPHWLLLALGLLNSDFCHLPCSMMFCFFSAWIDFPSRILFLLLRAWPHILPIQTHAPLFLPQDSGIQSPFQLSYLGCCSLSFFGPGCETDPIPSEPL